MILSYSGQNALGPVSKSKHGFFSKLSDPWTLPVCSLIGADLFPCRSIPAQELDNTEQCVCSASRSANDGVDAAGTRTAHFNEGGSLKKNVRILYYFPVTSTCFMLSLGSNNLSRDRSTLQTPCSPPASAPRRSSTRVLFCARPRPLASARALQCGRRAGCARPGPRAPAKGGIYKG